MDFIDELQELSAKIPKMRDVLQTEEATKNALIMPFINILGYEIFNPLEVIPEFVADVGIKKGEKVDYAIKKDEKIIMLFECKHCGGDLNIHHASQLFRYFAVTEARIAVLTNGIVYKFFTDLEAPNKMDEKPFLEIDLLELQGSQVSELKKLTKNSFDIDDLMDSAGELKYMRQIKRLLSEQLENPSDEFVKFVASKVFGGVLTESRREYFSGIAKRAFNQLINERINTRLKSAMSEAGNADFDFSALEQTDSAETAIEEKPISREDLIETTEAELEGFFIVKALLRGLAEPTRIVHRDTQSYMGILLDDNNRKPLARLYFNREQKYLGVFNEEREETRIPINSLDEIYEHDEELKRVFAFYESENN
ncbi:MAG: type I restriction endonuclease [Aridibacter sp.]|nr:type I restriction endonuclease [Acidobacteriota bacterium]